MGEIEEALKFDPGPAVSTAEDDEIMQALKFDPGPVGGTYKPTPATGREALEAGGTAGLPASYPPTKDYYNPPEEAGAGFRAMAETALVDKPITKVKIYAKARGIPIGDIASRYRIQDGKIEFKTESGKWQREISEHPGQQIKHGAAQIAGHPSTYLGTAGALVGGPWGALGGAVAGEAIRKQIASGVYGEEQTVWGNLFDIGLEGILALGGEVVGKLITGRINKFRMRKSKSLRFAGKEIREGLLTPKDHAKALYIETLANQHGITLAPHQLYDREGMTNIWMYLRKHPLTSNQVQQFDKALEEQTDAAIDGFIRKMGGYEQTPFQMGTELKQAAGDAIEQAESARQKAAGPYYKAAFEQTPTIDVKRLEQELKLNKQSIARAGTSDIPDVEIMVGELQKDAAMPTAYMKQKGEAAADYAERITKDYQRIVGKEVPITKSELAVANIEGYKKRNTQIEKILKGQKPEGAYVPTKILKVEVPEAVAEIDRLMAETVPSDPAYKALKKIKKMIEEAGGNPQRLDSVKRSGIDNVLNKTKTQRNLKRQMALVKKELTDAMDAQIPDYSAARGVYGQFGMAPPIDEMKNSVIGELSRLKKDDQIRTAVKTLFGTTNMPDYTQMAKARDIIMAQDPDLWRRAIGEYIKSIYYQLTVTEGGTVINAAGKMNKLLFGNVNRRKTMAAAFGGTNTRGYQTLKDLMTVLQRASIGKGAQSMTAPFQQIEKELAGAMGTQAKEAFKRPYDFLIDKAFESWNDTLLAGRQGALLDALLKPDVIKQIKELKLLKPGSKKLIEGAMVLSALVATKIGPEKLPETPEGQIKPH